MEDPGDLIKTTVRSGGGQDDLPGQACLFEGVMEPCVIVIFGASGDLTSRKLMPALYNLHLNDALPQPFVILGCGRTGLSREAFQERMRLAVERSGCGDLSRWDSFASSLQYQQIEYGRLSSYQKLAQKLRDLDTTCRTGGNRIFYLAIPPVLYPDVARMLSESGLSREMTDGVGWSRVVVEKPFGRDLKSARELDRLLHEGFQEHQIYRIDHYLAKETVQNIMIFRFGNAIFEPIWNRSYIDYVGIIAAETIGVEHRGRYYEEAGVLRDMFQSHMMQLLALTAMEPPSLFKAEIVRNEKVKVFQSLRPLFQDRPEESLILGQYGPGELQGVRIPGYREEPHVSAESLTPTFAVLRAFVENWRWHGVPFYLMSGKRMARKLTTIIIQFKEVPHSMFQDVVGAHIMANRLVIGIQPTERITLTFQTKSPGARICFRSVTMDFDYYRNYTGPLLDAYEKVLIDCIQGDHMLFWRQDAIELSWSFLTPVLEECEGCAERAERLHPYPARSWGPEAARSWIELMLGEQY